MRVPEGTQKTEIVPIRQGRLGLTVLVRKMADSRLRLDKQLIEPQKMKAALEARWPKNDFTVDVSEKHGTAGVGTGPIPLGQHECLWLIVEVAPCFEEAVEFAKNYIDDRLTEKGVYGQA